MDYAVHVPKDGQSDVRVVLTIQPPPQEPISLQFLLRDKMIGLEELTTVGQGTEHWTVQKERRFEDIGEAPVAFSRFRVSPVPNAPGPESGLSLSYELRPGLIQESIPCGEQRELAYLEGDVVSLSAASLLLLPEIPIEAVSYRFEGAQIPRALSTFPSGWVGPRDTNVLDMAWVGGDLEEIPMPIGCRLFASQSVSQEVRAAVSTVLQGMGKGLVDSAPFDVVLLSRSKSGLRHHSPDVPGLIVIDLDTPDVGSLRELVRSSLPAWFGKTREELMAGTEQGGWFLLGFSEYLAQVLPEEAGHANSEPGPSMEYTWMRERSGANIPLDIANREALPASSRKIKATIAVRELDQRLKQSGGLRSHLGGWNGHGLPGIAGEPISMAIAEMRDQRLLEAGASFPFEDNWVGQLADGPVFSEDQYITELTLAYTANTEAYMESCGCKVSQAGGVSKRSAAIRRLRGDLGQSLAVLDLGNFFPVEKNLSSLDAQVAAELGVYVDAMGDMGYDVACAGPGETAYGRELLMEMARRAGFPILGANVQWDGESMLDSTCVVQVAGIRLGIVGFSEKLEHAWLREAQERNTSGLRHQRDLAELSERLAEVREDVDLLAVAGSLSPASVRLLASHTTQVDLILNALPHAGMWDRPAGFVEDTLVAFDAASASGLNRLRMALNHERRIVAYLHETAILGDSAERDANIDKLLDDFYGSEEQSKYLPGAQAVLAWDDFSGGEYTGAESCKGCHQEEYLQWRNTPHATAMKTLNQVRRASHPDCVRCHVVGFGLEGGYEIGNTASQHLANVQCEVCHGAGAEHVANPTAANIRMTPPKLLCLECHDSKHSEAFEHRFDEAWDAVGH